MHLFRWRDVCIWFVGMLSYICNWVVGMLSHMCIWVFGYLVLGWWVCCRICVFGYLVFGGWVGGEEGLSGLLLRLTNRTH